MREWSLGSVVGRTGAFLLSFLFDTDVSRMRSWSRLVSQPLTILALSVILHMVVYHPSVSTLGIDSRFIAGNRAAEFVPTTFSSFLLPVFFLSLLISTSRVFPVTPHFLCSSSSLVIVETHSSSLRLALRLLPLPCLPCLVTNGGGERLTLYLSGFPTCVRG